MRHFQESLTFNDCLLLPQYSEITHRSDVDISTKILPNLYLKKPFISANMDTITEAEMAIAMAENGCLGILHRFMDKKKLSNQIQQISENISTPLVISIGINDDFDEIVAMLKKYNIKYICIDVAHGHHKCVKNTIENLKNFIPGVEIIAGNVCTYQGALDLFMWGADCVKVGVGPGSVCSTRIKTGCGCPQLSAILEAYQAKKEFQIKVSMEQQKFIIADGGIQYCGDITKALAAGADAVMLGGLLAGCKQTPSQPYRDNNNDLMKSYRGMASFDAQTDQGIEEIYEEGIRVGVKYKGSVRHILPMLTKGLQSGMSYCGARNIKDLQLEHKFVRISHSGFAEGLPHKLI